MNREVVPTYTNVKLGKRKNRSELLKRFEIINRKKNLNTVSKKKVGERMDNISCTLNKCWKTRRKVAKRL
jgi:hypothetical protein